MKAIITTLFSAYLLPFSLVAQPTVNNNEFYSTGDVIQMVTADISGYSAGPAGAEVSWDFSALSSTGTANTTVMNDTSTVFTASNIMEIFPTGQQEYIEENSTDSYINGIYDPSSGITAYYNYYDIAKRPFTYNSNFIDSYTVNIPGGPTPTSGMGMLVQKGDAYGTLVLPTGSFNNVLRVKKSQNETDTVGGASGYVVINNVTSYLWFDGVHAAPLLRIDSVSGSSTASQTIMYLAATAGVPGINAADIHCNAWFENNTLLLTGNFEANKSYNLVVYDMIGSKIYTQQFTGNDQSQRFDIDRQVAPGIYIVSITQTDNISSREIIKVLKH